MRLPLGWTALRRHPSRTELGAVFDGEGDPVAAGHIAGCARCQAWMGELHRVRAAVRGEPIPVAVPTRPARAARPPWLSPALAGVMAVLLLAVAGASGLFNRDVPTHLASQGDTEPLPAGSGDNGGPVSTRPVPPPGGATDGSPVPDGRPAGPAAAAPAAPPAPRPAAGSPAAPPGDAPNAAPPPAEAPVVAAPDRSGSGPLQLAVVVPTIGVRAGEGADVVEAAHRAVAIANRAGGADGRTVELVVVPAEDQPALDALPARADTLVGGFGVRTAPAGLPWVFPAEPDVEGPAVVRAEPAPLDAGARLGADLAARQPGATVGVVVAGAREAPMADGLARSVAVERVAAAAGTMCDREVAELRRRGASVIAVAGPPELAQRCAGATRTLLGSPEQLLVLPSAAYQRLEADPTMHGARTVLGLPWPSAQDPGARRFRAEAAGARWVRSYRALVTFAAVEAAVDSARATGSPVPLTGRYRSDLYDIDGGANRARTIVAASFGRWAAVE